MVNYYEILGLNYGAGILEIKASFRQLAKLYHPDKNPEGIEHFTKILRAYETLSDPVQKASYDYKLNYHQAQAQQQQSRASAATTKTWKFDERELKRRQYYNDHIKKYAKQTSEYMADEGSKKNYNEFKYILFATPLAVILFLLIMHFATRDREELQAPLSQKNAGIELLSGDTQKKETDLKLGDAPYSFIFGPSKYDTLLNKTLTVKNLSGAEVIVCLFSKEEFIRCFYLTESISAEVSQLPADPLYIYYCSGRLFDYTKELKSVKVSGAFTKDLAFYKSFKANRLNSFNELTLVANDNEGFEKIDEKEFFKRVKN